MKFKLILEHWVDNKLIITDGEQNDWFEYNLVDSENVHSVKILPKRKINMKNAYLIMDYSYTNKDRVYVNGYQSWTRSCEYSKNDVQRGILGLAQYVPFTKTLVTISGDYNFQDYTKECGIFHSYSYTYIKNSGQIYLLGTLNERTGYTIFHHDMNKNLLTIQKDVEGVSIEAEYELFNFYCIKDTYDGAFDSYFAKLALPKLKYDHLAGYTSWYNYYGNISEKQLIRDLDGLSKVGNKANIFQIDDGYQTRVGEWLTVKKEKFPNGMKFIADKIHSNNLLAGIWLAPFNVQKHSSIVKEHPDWIIKKPNSNSYQLGCVAWGGAYTLDFYNKEVAEHLKNVFRVVLHEWGFDMVKLDFLYSVCQTPRYNKSRGQIMCEAMDFLRECVGDKLILGCGVPLFPSWGKVDMCRISCDVAANFIDGIVQKNTNQEIISAQCAMINTIFRRHLDGRAFVNDPDVFYLRKSNIKDTDPYAVKTSGLKFTEEQKDFLANINNMCGNVLFVSDNVGDYSDAQLQKLYNAFAKTTKVVVDAEFLAPDIVSVYYKDGNKDYKLSYNIKNGKNSVSVLN